MKVIMAKFMELPKECPYCGGKVSKVTVRKQEQLKCAKCEERIIDNYEKLAHNIKKMIDNSKESLFQFVIEGDGKKVSKKSTELAGEKLELGNKYIISVNKNGYCRVSEVEAKNEGHYIKRFNDFI